MQCIKPLMFLIVLILLFQVFCSSSKKFVQIDCDFGSAAGQIDTITVFCDAAVAVKEENVFYSANASYVTDSLILYATVRTLKAKGYKVNIIQPPYMGIN